MSSWLLLLRNHCIFMAFHTFVSSTTKPLQSLVWSGFCFSKHWQLLVVNRFSPVMLVYFLWALMGWKHPLSLILSLTHEFIIRKFSICGKWDAIMSEWSRQLTPKIGFSYELFHWFWCWIPLLTSMLKRRKWKIQSGARVEVTSSSSQLC